MNPQSWQLQKFPVTVIVDQESLDFFHLLLTSNLVRSLVALSQSSDWLNIWLSIATCNCLLSADELMEKMLLAAILMASTGWLQVTGERDEVKQATEESQR